MKLNVTVDLDEFTLGDLYYNEGDDKVTISKVLKREIINEVVYRLKSDILKDANKEIKEAISSAMKDKVDKIIDDFKNDNETFEIKEAFNSEPKTVHFKEFVKNKFTFEFNNSYNVAKINTAAKEFAKELRERYDFTFASLLVKNMQKQKLLADDKIAELLKK